VSERNARSVRSSQIHFFRSPLFFLMGRLRAYQEGEGENEKGPAGDHEHLRGKWKGLHVLFRLVISRVGPPLLGDCAQIVLELLQHAQGTLKASPILLDLIQRFLHALERAAAIKCCVHLLGGGGGGQRVPSCERHAAKLPQLAVFFVAPFWPKIRPPLHPTCVPRCQGLHRNQGIVVTSTLAVFRSLQLCGTAQSRGARQS